MTANEASRHKTLLVEFYDGDTQDQLRELADYLSDTGYALLSLNNMYGFPEDMYYLAAVVQTGIDYS